MNNRARGRLWMADEGKRARGQTGMADDDNRASEQIGIEDGGREDNVLTLFWIMYYGAYT